MTRKRITGLDDYLSAVSTEHAGPGRTILFRGHSDSAFGFVPYLGRRPSPRSADWLWKEAELISGALKISPGRFPEDDLPLVRLARLQHYGVPTRLLDVSGNALVAMFFACMDESRASADGEILLIDTPVVSADDPAANAVADTCRLAGYSRHTYADDFIRLALRQPYASGMHAEETSGALMNALSGPLFVDAGDLNERQRRQCGYFMLFPNLMEMENGRPVFADRLAGMGKDDPRIIRDFIIPSELKLGILGQLCRLGISAESLFPDDYDMELLRFVDSLR